MTGPLGRTLSQDHTRFCDLHNNEKVWILQFRTIITTQENHLHHDSCRDQFGRTSSTNKIMPGGCNTWPTIEEGTGVRVHLTLTAFNSFTPTSFYAQVYHNHQLLCNFFWAIFRNFTIFFFRILCGYSIFLRHCELILDEQITSNERFFFVVFFKSSHL